jgi:hypothetical protein
LEAQLQAIHDDAENCPFALLECSHVEVRQVLRRCSLVFVDVTVKKTIRCNVYGGDRCNGSCSPKHQSHECGGETSELEEGEDFEFCYRGNGKHWCFDRDEEERERTLYET